MSVGDGSLRGGQVEEEIMTAGLGFYFCYSSVRAGDPVTGYDQGCSRVMSKLAGRVGSGHLNRPDPIRPEPFGPVIFRVPPDPT